LVGRKRGRPAKAGLSVLGGAKRFFNVLRSFREPLDDPGGGDVYRASSWVVSNIHSKIMAAPSCGRLISDPTCQDRRTIFASVASSRWVFHAPFRKEMKQAREGHAAWLQ
jgi:hypothetical protein